jgi:hypothetical protein
MQVVLLQSNGKECHALQFVHRNSTSSEEVATTAYCLDASDPFWLDFLLLDRADLEFIASTVNRFLVDFLGQNVPSSLLTSSNPAADLERAADEGCLFGSIPFAPPKARALHDLPLSGYQSIESIERIEEDGVKVTLRFLKIEKKLFIANIAIMEGVLWGPGLIVSTIAWALGEAVDQHCLLLAWVCAGFAMGFSLLFLKLQFKATSWLTVGRREWSLVQSVPKLSRVPGLSVQKGLLTDLISAKVCILIPNFHACTALIPVQCSDNRALWCAVGEHCIEVLKLWVLMHDFVRRHPHLMSEVLL